MRYLTSLAVLFGLVSVLMAQDKSAPLEVNEVASTNVSSWVRTADDLAAYRAKFATYQEAFQACLKSSYTCFSTPATFDELTAGQTNFVNEVLLLRAKAKGIRKHLREDEFPEVVLADKSALISEISQFVSKTREVATFDTLDEWVYSVCRELGEKLFYIPKPGEGRVEEEYFRVAYDFYRHHLVENFKPPKGMDEKTAQRVLKIREALARYFTTSYLGFIIGDIWAEADDLRQKGCTDAAVAIAWWLYAEHDAQAYKAQRVFAAAGRDINYAQEPVLGFLMKIYALNAAVRLCSYQSNADGVQYAKERLRVHLAEALPYYEAADFRLLPRLLPFRFEHVDLYEVATNNTLLAYLEKGELYFDKAFDSRGTGWAHEVTEEGWSGWGKYNTMAVETLQAAIKEHPSIAEPWFWLSSIYGCSCGSGMEHLCCRQAIARSISYLYPNVEGYLQFQTSRWGGSTKYLIEVFDQVTTSVDTRTMFSILVASDSLYKLLRYEWEDDTVEYALSKFYTPERQQHVLAMMDAYLAAPENEWMPPRIFFANMALGMAIQMRNWKAARKYRELCLGLGDKNPRCYWFNLFSSFPHRDKYFFYALLSGSEGEKVIEAEEAYAAGNWAEALRLYTDLHQSLSAKPENLNLAKIVDFRRYELRPIVEGANGDWVSLMPTKSLSESFVYYTDIITDTNGWAHARDWKDQAVNVNLVRLPGLNVEYKATVCLGRNPQDKRARHINWGFARKIKGCEAKYSHVGMPSISFVRDDKGDHAYVSLHFENTDEATKQARKKTNAMYGRIPLDDVASRDLESKPEHDFVFSMQEEDCVVTVDGQELWRYNRQRLFNEANEYYKFYDENYRVSPSWHVFDGTRYKDYSIRLLKQEKSAESNPR